MIVRQQRKEKIWVKKRMVIPVAVVLWINIYMMNPFGIAQNQFSMMFGYGIAQVLSGSMEPTFSEGTILLVKKTQKVKIGDIIVYQSGSELVVHRVMDIKEDIIFTKGDANLVADKPFHKSDVRGVVIGWIPDYFYIEG